MKKYFVILMFTLLFLLHACSVDKSVDDNKLDGYYELYESYNYKSKDNLVKSDIFHFVNYLDFSDKVGFHFGSYDFIGPYEVNGSKLVISEFEFTISSDENFIELDYDNALYIFKKDGVNLNLKPIEKEYLLENKNIEKFSFDLYKNETFKLVYKNGDFPITTNGVYYNYINYIVLYDNDKYFLVEKFDKHIILNYLGMSLKLVTDGSDHLEENPVNSFDYKKDTLIMNELEMKIDSITSNDQYILEEKLLTSNEAIRLESYPEYKYFYSEFGTEYLYYDGVSVESTSDGYYASRGGTGFTSKEFFSNLNQEYLIYQKNPDTYYLSISIETFLNNEYKSHLIANYLYFNKSHLYFEVIFNDDSFKVNVHNNNNLKFSSQQFTKHSLDGDIDISKVKQMAALNLKDAIFPVLINEDYVFNNDKYQYDNIYYRIDFKQGYYTIQTSEVERIIFKDENGEPIYLKDVFNEYESLETNHDGNLLKFYVSQPVTYYLEFKLKSYYLPLYYDFSFEVRYFDNIELETIDYNLGESLDVEINDIFFGKVFNLTFNTEKVININAEALGDKLYIEVLIDGSRKVATYVNSSFEHSIIVPSGSILTIKFRQSTNIILTEAIDDEYNTNVDSPFDLNNYKGEKFVTGSTFNDDYFIFDTTNKFYKFYSGSYAKLVVTNVNGDVITESNAGEFYILEPNNKYYINVSYQGIYIEYDFAITEVLSGNLIVDSFPFNNNIYIDEDATVEFTLPSKSLVYINASYKTFDLLKDNNMLIHGVDDIAVVLEAGAYLLKSNITYTTFVDLEIEIINSNTNKLSFNEGISLGKAININYEFEHEKEVFRIITDSYETLKLNVEGTAEYYIRTYNEVDSEPLKQGYMSISKIKQDVPLEIYAKGKLNVSTQIKIFTR